MSKKVPSVIYYKVMSYKSKLRQFLIEKFSGENVSMNYMLAHHIVVQHKLNEHCAQRFVSNTHFSKLFRFCTY